MTRFMFWFYAVAGVLLLALAVGFAAQHRWGWFAWCAALGGLDVAHAEVKRVTLHQMRQEARRGE